VEFIHEANIVEICTGGLATAGRKIADKRREEPSSADPVIVETRVGCDTRRLAGQAAPSEKRLRYRNRAKTGDVGCLAAFFGLNGRENYRELRPECYSILTI